jgi:hypothetical protein
VKCVSARTSDGNAERRKSTNLIFGRSSSLLHGLWKTTVKGFCHLNSPRSPALSVRLSCREEDKTPNNSFQHALDRSIACTSLTRLV